MKLSFKISPNTTGFTAKIFYPDYSKLKFSLTNDKGKGKFEVNGSIKLSSSDTTFLSDTVGTTAYNIKAYLKGNLYFTCDYKSINTINQDFSFKQVDLDLTAETTYTGDEWKNYNKEYNINDIAPVNNDLRFVPGYIQLYRYASEFTSKRLETNSYVDSSLGVANYDIEFIDDLISSSVVPPDPFYEYDGTVHYVREQALGFYLNLVAYEPDEDGGWTYITDQTINGIDYPEYFRTFTGTNNYNFTPGTEAWTYIENANLLYSKPAIEYTGVTRLVTTVIEKLLDYMGVNVSMDRTGTSTDSFYSFKSMVGESLKYGSTTTTLMYSRLLIMNLTDFIPADDDGQKDVPAAITNVSLKTILDYFESLDFEGFIEDRSGTDYFVLQHKSDKTLSSGNPDLSNYYNKNRTYLADKWTKEPPEFHKIVNETTCKSIDFVGTDVVFNKVYGTDSEKAIVDNKIFTDLNDIANRRSDVYSDNDVSNIVIIAAQSDSTVIDYVREATGIMTTSKVNNSELSFSFLAKNIFGDYPDADFTTNGTNYTAATSQLKKRDKLELNIPADNMQDDYDVSNYVLFGSDETEIVKTEQNSYDTTLKLTLKK